MLPAGGRREVLEPHFEMADVERDRYEVVDDEGRSGIPRAVEVGAGAAEDADTMRIVAEGKRRRGGD